MTTSQPPADATPTPAFLLALARVPEVSLLRGLGPRRLVLLARLLGWRRRGAARRLLS
jgi:hypothetical protein